MYIKHPLGRMIQSIYNLQMARTHIWMMVGYGMGWHCHTEIKKLLDSN